MSDYQERIENFYNHLIEGKLNDEDLGFFYKKCDPFIKDVIDKYGIKIGRVRSFGYLSLLVSSLMQLYALTDINYIVLKYNLEKELKRNISEDEVFEIANKMNPSIIKNIYKKLDFNIPWEEKALIYQRMNQIDMLLQAPIPSFLEKYKKNILNDRGLDALFSKRWQVFCGYYQCIKNVQERCKLKQLDGISEFADRYFRQLEQKYKMKLNSNQLVLLPDFFPSVKEKIKTL